MVVMDCPLKKDSFTYSWSTEIVLKSVTVFIAHSTVCVYFKLVAVHSWIVLNGLVVFIALLLSGVYTELVALHSWVG